MPTGYTAMIDDDPNLSTAKWVMRGLSRNFGVCVTLRDHNQDLTEDEIEEYLKNEVIRDTNYHRKILIAAQKTLEQISKNPEEVWSELYASVIDDMNTHNARNIKETDIIKSRHQQVIEDLIKLRDNTKDGLTRTIAQFGLSQLEMVKRDTEPYLSTIPSFKKFKEDKTTSLNWDVKYHTEKLEEIEKRTRERLFSYQRLRSEVKEILGYHSLSKKVNEK